MPLFALLATLLSPFCFRLSTFDFRLSPFDFLLLTFSFRLSSFVFRLSTFAKNKHRQLCSCRCFVSLLEHRVVRLILRHYHTGNGGEHITWRQGWIEVVGHSRPALERLTITLTWRRTW